jgi:hypothetical protein
MAAKTKPKDEKKRAASEAARFDYKTYGLMQGMRPNEIVMKMADLVRKYEAQIITELTRLKEFNDEAKHIIVKAGKASGHPFHITFSEEILELDVPQFKYLDFEVQRTAKFLLAQLKDIKYGRLEKMMKERADWEQLDLRNPWNHVMPVESCEDTQDPGKEEDRETGKDELVEDGDARQLEELEALASAAIGPFPTIWEGVPAHQAFQGFYNMGKAMHDKMTQTEAQYTAQLVSVEPARSGMPGEKFWHFHNGAGKKAMNVKEEEVEKVIKNKRRRKDAMPPPDDIKWRNAIQRSREAAPERKFIEPTSDAYTPTLVELAMDERQRSYLRRLERASEAGAKRMATKTTGSDAAPDWLAPFDPSEASSETASGSGAYVSHLPDL